MTAIEKLFEKFIRDASISAIESSTNIYRTKVKKFLAFAGDRTPDSITLADVSEFLRELGKTHNNTGVRFSRQMIMRFFLWMEDNGHIAKSPLNPRKMPKIYSIPSPRRAIAHEHYLRLLAAAKKLERNWQWFEAIVIGWNTGLRIQDVSNLKWEQVDLVNDVITITPQKTRRFNKSLTIPIEPELRGVLAGMNRMNQFVLPTLAYHGMFYKGSAAYSASRYHLAKIFNDAKMPPGYSFHSLRHGIVTRMINNGVDAIIISSITGQTLEVIQGYAHVSMEAKKNALERARPIPQTQPQMVAA